MNVYTFGLRVVHPTKKISAIQGGANQKNVLNLCGRSIYHVGLRSKDVRLILRGERAFY